MVVPDRGEPTQRLVCSVLCPISARISSYNLENYIYLSHPARCAIDASSVIKAPPSPYAPRFLPGQKTKTHNLPKLPYEFAAVLCSMRLRSIIDHR